MTLHPLPQKTPPKAQKPPRAPTHLTTKTRAWWRRIAEAYQFEEFELRLLTCAAEAFDRKEAARLVIEKQGLTYLDRFGQPASRPEIAIERDSRLAFFRCMRQLALSEDGPENRPRARHTAGRMVAIRHTGVTPSRRTKPRYHGRLSLLTPFELAAPVAP